MGECTGVNGWKQWDKEGFEVHNDGEKEVGFVISNHAMNSVDVEIRIGMLAIVPSVPYPEVSLTLSQPPLIIPNKLSKVLGHPTVDVHLQWEFKPDDMTLKYFRLRRNGKFIGIIKGTRHLDKAVYVSEDKTLNY